MGRSATVIPLGRRGPAAVAAIMMASSLLVASVGVAAANAAPDTTLYASTSGFDTTGTSGCLTTSDFCSLQGAFDAAAALSSGTVAIYLESSGAATTFQGESNTLYSFNDPGLDVTVQPDPSLGVGAISVFDARFVPGSSILTLSGSGSVSLSDLQMQNADSTTSGGAIWIRSDLTVSVNDVTFDNNQTVANSNGGAIGIDNAASANLIVSNSDFANNWAIGVGGAIGGFQNNGTTTITDSTFTDNHGDYGGAIGEGAYGTGTLSVTGSTFQGNSAIYGGAIDNADIVGASNAVVQYSTFVDNVASSTGGAIANGVNSGTGTMVVVRSTFDDGAATTPAIAAGGGSTTFAGSLLAGSSPTLCAGAIDDAGFNLESDVSASCGFAGSSDAAPGSDPAFAALADNGGPTMTELVSAASAAAAAIPSSPATSVSINSTPYVVCATPDVDQTGVARSTPHGCALGAVDAAYSASQSMPRVVAPVGAQSATQSFALSATGGSGTISYTFATATSGCTVHGATLSFTGTTLPTTCEVSVTNAANGPYLTSTPSPTQAFTFVSASASAPLVITTTAGLFATPLVVTTSGGSGDGATTFSVVNGSAGGCAMSATAPFTLTSTSAGTCVVQATKAASGIYLAATSMPTVIVIAATTPQPPVIHLSSRHVGAVYVAVQATSLGGDPVIAIQYSLNAGRWRAAFRHGHGLIEVTGLRKKARTTIRVRVFTAAGPSVSSAAIRFVAR